VINGMSLIGRLLCLMNGHIPIHDGHVTVEVYGYFFTPDEQKLNCARCGSTLHLIRNSFLLEKVERWQLSGRAIKSLKAHQMIGDI